MAEESIPERFADEVRRIVSDLTTLEINTIVTDSILGTKMPGVRHALVKIARDYDNQLALYGYGRPRGEHDEPPPPIRGGRDAFDDLYERALRLVLLLQQKSEMHFHEPSFNPPLSAEEAQMHQMACRIEEKSSQLKGLFNAVQRRGKALVETGELDISALHNDYGHGEIEENRAALGRRFDFPVVPDELVLIRKIWDIGTDNISMQTIVQLDGDVVTRIHSGFLGEDHEITRKIHEKMIQTSISTWDGLVRLVGDFFRSAAAAFLPK